MKMWHPPQVQYSTPPEPSLAAALAMRDRPGPRIPQQVVEAMMAADDATHDAMAAALDARAGEDVPPAEVVALWRTISNRGT